MSFVTSEGVDSTPAFTIEVDDVVAGLALRERSGFSFVAADPRFRLLDGSRFRRLHQIEAAARNVLRASLPHRRLHAA
ncbi:hypothetical protein [Zavarzinia sp.]|uniref:hypothetical protein n=1 Tax=Zavarzinia sp. TaxID=2027920 RepID=UPI00356647BC